jgi:hypothetical protein
MQTTKSQTLVAAIAVSLAAVAVAMWPGRPSHTIAYARFRRGD